MAAQCFWKVDQLLNL